MLQGAPALTHIAVQLRHVRQHYSAPSSLYGSEPFWPLLMPPPSQDRPPKCIGRLARDAFYVPAHQLIYDLILDLLDNGKPIDFVSLKQALKDCNQLEEIGGVECLNELFTFVPTASNAEHYTEIVSLS